MNDRKQVSLVIETENLSMDYLRIYPMLESLQAQEYPVSNLAKVYILLPNGISRSLILQIKSDFAFLHPLYVPNEFFGYYKMQMWAATQIKTKYILYGDSDCVFEVEWLKSIMQTIRDYPDLDVLAGETFMKVSGGYSYGMLLSFKITTFGGKTGVLAGSEYFMNNVLFKRDILLRFPIPTNRSYFSGYCNIHVTEMNKNGIRILTNSKMKALHLAVFPSHIKKFYHLGQDHSRMLKSQLQGNNSFHNDEPFIWTEDLITRKIKTIQGSLDYLVKTAAATIKQEKRHLKYLFPGILFALFANFIQIVGYLSHRSWGIGESTSSSAGR